MKEGIFCQLKIRPETMRTFIYQLFLPQRKANEMKYPQDRFSQPNNSTRTLCSPQRASRKILYSKLTKESWHVHSRSRKSEWWKKTRILSILGLVLSRMIRLKPLMVPGQLQIHLFSIKQEFIAVFNQVNHLTSHFR